MTEESMPGGSPPRPARRRIAIAATAGLMAMIPLAFFKSVAGPNADIISTLIYVLGLIVGAYMGVQIAPEIWGKKV